MNWWTIVFFYIAGMLALATELFIPGAIVGICGFLTCCAAIFMAYHYEYPILGHILIGVSIVSAPIFFWLWKTLVVRVMGLSSDEAGFTAQGSELSELLGTEGVTTSPLRPSGMATINGKRVDVVTRGVMVASGMPVKVVEVSGNQVVVKPL